jgi:hypothetical protein
MNGFYSVLQILSCISLFDFDLPCLQFMYFIVYTFHVISMFD